MATTDPRTPALDALDGLLRLATYPYHVLSYVDDDGYPVNVAVVAEIDADGRHRQVRAAGRSRRPGRAATSA